MKKLTLTLLLALVCNFGFAQKQEPFRIDSLPKQGILLDKGWKWHPGDNPDFAKADYDDSAWESIDPTRTIHDLPQIRKEVVGWFRLKIHVDSSLLNKPLGFFIYQSIASEIYLDGKLLKQFGVVSSNKKEIKAILPLNDPLGFQFGKPDQVLAARFSVQPDLAYFINSIPLTTFRIGINDVLGIGQFNRIEPDLPILHGVYKGIFIVLTIIHFGFFLFYKKQKSNLFFSLATFLAALANIMHMEFNTTHDVSFKSHVSIIMHIFYPILFNLFLLIAVYLLFSKLRKTYFWLLVAYSIASIFIYQRDWLFGTLVPFLLVTLEAIRVGYHAYRQKFHDAGIIVFGFSSYLVFFILFWLIENGVIANEDIGMGDNFQLNALLYHIFVNWLPLVLSIYFFRNFAFTSGILEKKLVEVQQLSEENHQILANQNETLERQVGERTAELRASQVQLIQKEKLASLGELTAGIAHEIQNPLNFVNNFSELSVDLVKELKEEIEKPKQDKEYIGELFDDLGQNQEKINHHGKRASSIVKGMLEHSRTSTGERVLTDINKLADEYLRLSYLGIRSKDNNFNSDYQTDFEENLPKIEVIPQDIGRVLLNLINNAFWAVNERGKKGETGYEPKVTVTTQLTANSQLLIAIKDNGTGMTEDVKAKIFQPFFTTKPTGQGTGLGLSLAYDIITKGHGGTLEVESKEGEGTTFIVKLPIV